MDRHNIGAPVEFPEHDAREKPSKQTTEVHMKRTVIALACALVAPLAFAQTSTTTTETTTEPATTTQTTSTTYTAGTVTTYEPGKTVVVRGEQGPVSFALGTAARIVDGAGKIVTAPLRAGQKVRVYYTGPTESRTVERVVVEDND
jgi:endonuclease YncB( thermonuclease family)